MAKRKWDFTSVYYEGGFWGFCAGMATTKLIDHYDELTRWISLILFISVYILKIYFIQKQEE